MISKISGFDIEKDLILFYSSAHACVIVYVQCKDYSMKKLMILVLPFVFVKTALSITVLPENEHIKKVPVQKVEELFKFLEKDAEFKKRYEHAIKYLREFAKSLAVNNKSIELGSAVLHAALEQKIENKNRKITGYDVQARKYLTVSFPNTPKQREKAEQKKRYWELKMEGEWNAKAKGGNIINSLEESEYDLDERRKSQKSTGYEDPKVTRQRTLYFIEDFNAQSVAVYKKLALFQDAHYVHTRLIALINNHKFNCAT